MNKFTLENVGELFNKIKNAETYSELVRCLLSLWQRGRASGCPKDNHRKYIEKVFMFDLFKIKDNNDDYIDIETDTSISSISLMFYNKCKCKITR